jgi:ABC-type phosphate transport system substrate-binding protein
MRVAFYIVMLVVVFCAVAPAGDSARRGHQFVIIVNKQNQLNELSLGKLKTIFLRRISRWPWGAAIEPLDSPAGSTVRLEFTREVLDSTAAEVAVYWIDQKATRNVSPPSVAPSIEAAKASVAAHAGGIAYIPSSAVDDRVKILEIIP